MSDPFFREKRRRLERSSPLDSETYLRPRGELLGDSSYRDRLSPSTIFDHESHLTLPACRP